MDVENIIANSKTLKQLTKDISAIAKSSGSGGTASSSTNAGVTGINRVDQKIDDIKDAFNNNSTVRFLKDPAGVLGKGLQGMIKPFTSFLPNMAEQIKKFNPFASIGNRGVSKSLAALEKSTAANTKILETIAGNTISGDEIAGGMQEALGQTVMRDSIKQLNLQETSLQELARLRTQFTVLPDQMMGIIAAPINKAIDGSISMAKNLGKTILGRKKEDEQISELSKIQHELAAFGKVSNADTEAQMHQQQAHHNERITALHSLQGGSMADKLSAEHLQNLENILLGDTDLSKQQYLFNIRERKRILNQDQAIAEEKRDDVNRQTELFEGLGSKLSQIAEALGVGGEGEKTSKKAGGIFDWIKKNFMGIGGGLAVGAGAAGAGISGLFLGMINTLTEGFRILGRRRVMVTRGAGTLAIMGLSLLPFAGSLLALNKAMEGFTLKKVGVFASMLGVLGLAVAGFSAAIATGVGGAVVAGAIGLLALLGAALIPFGYAISLAGDGIRPAAQLFSALAEVKWSSFFLAGPALTALASALRGFKGLPEIAGGDTSALGVIDGIGDKISSTLPGAAQPIKDFQSALNGLSEVKIDASVAAGLSEIYTATKPMFFKKRLEDAGKGMKSLLGDINSELNKMNLTALDKVSNLLSGGQIGFDSLQANNDSGAIINAGNANLVARASAPVVVDNSTGGSNTNITVNQAIAPHVGDDTMALLAN